jgi:hypothetical protein
MGYETAPPPPVMPQQNSYNPSYSPSPSYSMPAAAPARSKTVPIVAALIGVVLLAAGVGGFFVLRNSSATSDETKTETGGNQTGDTTEPKKNGDTTGGPVAGGTKETLTYWLEVQAAAAGGKSARVAGVVPLASEQSFKLHFTPRENGYLYIVGPGEKNVPMTFLTAKPIPESGVTSNEVKSGVDYSFPRGDGNWITLDKLPGTENYTVIFSPTPLSSPSFLGSLAGHALTAGEQKEWEDFKAQFKANAPVSDVVNVSGVDPFVSIKIPQAKPSGEPVIFDMRIEHK